MEVFRDNEVIFDFYFCFDGLSEVFDIWIFASFEDKLDYSFISSFFSVSSFEDNDYLFFC